MSPIKVEQVVGPVVLGEGPHWDADLQSLFFVSIFDRTIHKYVPATGKETRTKLDGMPTFIIPVEGHKDQFVISLNRKLVLIRWSGEDGESAEIIKEVSEVDQENPNNRFNDAKTDPKGRLFAGTMGHEYEPGQFHLKKGSLYRFNPKGEPTRLVSGVDISNGLCWDVNEKAFYFIDSFEYNIRRYDYDVNTGDIGGKPKLIFSFRSNDIEGIPDGMTIDTDGNLWIANFDGSKVIKVDPRSGKLLETVAIPALQTTSVTFGGANLDELYVTSASMNRGTEQLPPCGSTFKITGLGVKGYAGIPYKLSL